MKKGLEACKRKTCTKIRSSIRESPQAQPSNIVTSSDLASHLLWANSARSKDAVKTGIDKSTEAVGMCLALLSPSRKKVRTPRGVREILAPFPGCISFNLASQGRRSRVAPGYALKPLRGKSDTLLGKDLGK